MPARFRRSSTHLISAAASGRRSMQPSAGSRWAERLGRASSAHAEGARVVTRPTLLPFGERVARIRDAQGHLWWLHERVEEVGYDELMARLEAPDARAAMAYVQRSLQEELQG
jgi:hypothetical protein